MAMKVIKCPDCGHELARVILGGGTIRQKAALVAALVSVSSKMLVLAASE